MTVSPTNAPDDGALKIYQEAILEHNRSPRGCGNLPGATHAAQCFNPICGDQVDVKLILVESQVQKILFQSQACALCRASASMMVEAVSSMSVDKTCQLRASFLAMIEGEGPLLAGPLRVFGVLRSYPARAKCVKLPWETLEECLKSESILPTTNKIPGSEV